MAAPLPSGDAYRGSSKIDGSLRCRGPDAQSGGDIAVGKGILGRKTQVKAEGNIRAQLVQEASLRAGKEIQVGNYIYHANVKAKGKVIVSRGKGSRGGSIMGGETWGMLGVEALLPVRPAKHRRCWWRDELRRRSVARPVGTQH